MHTTEALIPQINLDLIQTLAIAGIVYLTGMMVKRKIKIFERLNIPSAVLGGLLFAAFNLVSHDRLLNKEVNFEQPENEMNKVGQAPTKTDANCMGMMFRRLSREGGRAIIKLPLNRSIIH
jgi:Na+/glutamate symporter